MPRRADNPHSRHPAFGTSDPMRARDHAPVRRRRRGPGPLLSLVVVAAAVWFALGRPTSTGDLSPLAPPPEAAPAGVDLTAPPADAEGPFPVVRVVDGDTLIVARPEGETRVRVIGIDTPESVAPDRPVECFGPEAAQRAEQLLAGTSVMVQGDPTQDRTDTYGRELDYVWLPDGRLFNHVMLTEGFALEYTFSAPYAYQADFRAAEQQASAAEVGLWSPTSCGADPSR